MASSPSSWPPDAAQGTVGSPDFSTTASAVVQSAAVPGEWISAEALQSELLRVCELGEIPTVDLNTLNFLDTAALQVLLAADAEQKRHGRRIALVNASDDLKAWFGYSGAEFQFQNDQQGAQ